MLLYVLAVGLLLNDQMVREYRGSNMMTYEQCMAEGAELTVKAQPLIDKWNRKNRGDLRMMLGCQKVGVSI